MRRPDSTPVAPRRHEPRFRVHAGKAAAVRAAAVLGLGLLSATAAAAEGPVPFVAVVDGSGSMWGALGSDGVNKIGGVRQSLEKALAPVADRTPIGLVTFGPGCRAAEVVVAPTIGGGERALAQLARFNPRGKGPLVAGMEAAAQSIPPGGAGHIVVFHDGLDNCGQDVCAAARSIKAARPKVVVHTVSLGLAAAELKAMACVAEATGGRAIAVADPGMLESSVAMLARIAGGDAQPPAATPQPVAPAAATAEPKGPPRLVATASLAAGRPAVTMPLAWKVTDPATGAVLYETVASSLSFQAKPGPVRIEATAGKLVSKRDVDIAAAGPTTVELALDAGLIRFETGAKKLANEADEPLIRLDRIADAGGAGRQRAIATPLWIARGTAAEALLPPGRYFAVAEFGLARAETELDVSAGSESSVLLALEAGRLELSTSGAAAERVVYALAVDDPSRPSGQREIARAAHPSPAFVLSTGSYVVTALIDGAEVRRVVAVRQGEVTSESIATELGRIVAAVTLNGAKPGESSPLLVSIKPLDSGDTAERPIPSGRPIAVEPGRYRVTARLGRDGPAAVRDVEVAAGKDARTDLALGFGELQIDGTPVGGDVSTALCELRDARNQRVWRGIETASRIKVAPGRYTFTCGSGAMRRETAVVLAAGDRKTVSTQAR